MSRAKIYLGIDPGLARLGWGVINAKGSDLQAVDYGVIETKANTDPIQRLLTIHTELQSIIESYNPEIVAIEKLFFGKNAKTAMAVGEARGVTLLTIAQHDLPIIEYSPAEIKIAITGYGNADKAQMQKMVQATLKIDEIPKPDDAADALAVGITAAVSTKLDKVR